MGDKIMEEKLKSYEPMVDHHIRKYVMKNWRDVTMSKSDMTASLGCSGWSLEDFRQYLMTEVFVAITKYNPNYITKEGRTVKESTFVYTHLFNRLGSMLKRITKPRLGYGVFHSQLEQVLGEDGGDES